jgi:DNA-binding transcriptional LysR family regulator
LLDRDVPVGLAAVCVDDRVAVQDRDHDEMRDARGRAPERDLLHGQGSRRVNERAVMRLRRPQDLTAHGFIQLSSRPPRLTLTSPGRKPVTVAVHSRISVDSAAAVRELALAGAGIATLPELLVRDDLPGGRLVAVLPKWTVASVGVYAVWPSHAQRAELTQAFVAFVAPRFASLFGG